LNYRASFVRAEESTAIWNLQIANRLAMTREQPTKARCWSKRHQANGLKSKTAGYAGINASREKARRLLVEAGTPKALEQFPEVIHGEDVESWIYALPEQQRWTGPHLRVRMQNPAQH
jgi:hypothetical protein